MSAASNSPGYRFLLLALLTAGFALNSLDRSLIAVLLVPIGREFNATDTQLGFLTGFVFAIVYTVAGVPTAAWADRGKHRIVLGIGMLLWSVMTAACGLAPAFIWMLLARMGVAAGESVGTPTSHALLSQAWPAARRSTALALYGGGAPAGAALAGILGGYGSAWLGWRGSLLVAAVPGIIIALIILFVLRDPVNTDARTQAVTLSWRDTLQTLVSNTAYRHLWFGAALHCMSLFGTLSFATAFMMRIHGWQIGAAGALVSALGIAGTFGTLGTGWISDSLVRRFGDARWTLRVSALTALLAVPLQCVAFLASNAYWPMVLIPLASMIANGFIGPTYSAAQSFAPPAARSRSTVVLMLAMTLAGMGTGPLAIGMLSDALHDVAGNDALRYALLLSP
ncbi:MAG: MFS transporter, partial [Steroidobacteraceae bacterium]